MVASRTLGKVYGDAMSSSSSTPPSEADVVDWGPRRRAPNRAQRLVTIIIAAVGIAALLAAWWVGDRPWSAHYSQEQVAVAYLPPGWGRTALPWQPSTIETSPTDPQDNYVIQPRICRYLIAPAVDPRGHGSVRAQLASSSGNDDGLIQTRRYDSLNAARASYQETIDTVQACSTFTAFGPAFRTTITDQRNRLSRSDASFTMTGSDPTTAGGTTVTLRSTVTRYANTVTWIVTSTEGTTDPDLTRSIANQLIEQLQATRHT